MELVEWAKKLRSPDRVERCFNLVILYIALMTFYFCLIVGPQVVLVCTIWASLLLLAVSINVYLEKAESPWAEWSRLPIFLLLGFSVLVYFDGSNKVNHFRFLQFGQEMLFDGDMLKLDELLLGWAFPKGQFALWLDTNPYIGPLSPIGRIYAEVLQVLYVSYYFWGNVLLVWLGFLYFKSIRGTAFQRFETKKRALGWRRAQVFLTAWVGTYMLNFTLNMAFPCTSPRIFIAYTNPIQGLWLADVFRSAVATAARNSYSAFPSGHCGLSALAAFLAFRFGYPKYGRIAAIASALIATATITLRYHYFCDALFAIPMVLAGIYFAGIESEKSFLEILQFSGQQDDDISPGSPRGKDLKDAV